MDPFDEFEFKPINDGIGFHKKSVQFKKELDVTQSMPSVSMPLSRPLQKGADETPRQTVQPKATASNTGSAQPLSRQPYQTPVQPPAPAQPAAPQPAIKPRLPFHDFTDTPTRPSARETARPAPNFSAAPQTTSIRPIEEVNVYIPSIIFDTIVVIGLTCLFAAAVLLVIDVDLATILQIAQTDFMTMLALVLLAFSVLELYLIIFRSFLGSTLGEWAFDIQLGSRAEQASPYYPLRVIWRSVIVIATGFVTLPLLSLLTGRDLAGRLAGLSLKRSDNIG
ncbi:MAG TPA: RDD family protein [Bdellovibrionales bacterium]|nr:RDD family protein [Bdellovibrionales bacterium]